MIHEEFLQDWEPVIGLEVHAQLNTKTKLFSRAPNRFGDDPNTNLSMVCTAQPGALPMLNRQAVYKAVRLGLGLGSEIARTSRFDRKSYFYPDAPRNFQITQYEHPILRGGVLHGWLDGSLRTFQVERAHLEDDAGMLKHFSSFAGVDLNRAGVPLVEVVSAPCLHSSAEALSYLQALRVLLQYLDVSDASMELGHLRVDCNISVRKKGETGLRPRVEIKNMNSFHNLQLAIESETRRQVALYVGNPAVPAEQLIQRGTYRFDLDSRRVHLMRLKEGAEDYRYCPEPDLPCLVLSDQDLHWLQETLPELPHRRLIRYTEQYGIAFDLAWYVIHEPALCRFFEQGLHQATSPKDYANWVLSEFVGRFKSSVTPLELSGITAEHIAELSNLILSKEITGKMAKQLADTMVEQPGVAPSVLKAGNKDYQPLNTEEALYPLVEEVLAHNQQSVEDLRAGKQRAFGFLVGQVMAKTRGRADPELVNRLLKESLERF